VSDDKARRCKLKPVEPCVERSWSKRFKLNFGEPFSNVAFNSNLRRHNKEMQTKIAIVSRLRNSLPQLLARLRQVDVGTKLGSAHYLLSTAHKVRRCMLTP